MESRSGRPLKEREETDASLLAERTKTDKELAHREMALREDEDRVVEVARNRAEETIETARALADAKMGRAGATRSVQEKVASERAIADEVLERERAAAEQRLRIEREQHRRALSELLALEREATDAGLLLERARADEVVATRDDFMAMVSHDLRNILGTIAMSASMLAREETSEVDGATPKDLGALIHRSAARMNRVVGDLLDVVSLEAGKLRVTRGPQDAVGVAREAVAAFQPSYAAKGVELTALLPTGAMTASFDHDRILQVLANLLSNALKFTERGGRVALSLEQAGASAHFCVTDTGVGIPAGHEEAIFERFAQLKPDRRGHGLGLYIAKAIVEAHDGAIWTETPAAGGAAMHFTVPMTTVVRG
jgi:signal transduction histidine kinase